jgi:hypothetical protein
MLALTADLTAAPSASLATSATGDGADPTVATRIVRPSAPIDEDVTHLDMALWRPESQHYAFELGAGPLLWRRVGSADAAERHGFEGGVGTQTAVRPRPFVIAWGSGLTLRVLDSASFALSYVQYVSVGLSIGPVEPDVRAAFSIATIDVFHGNWSAELLSPRVSAGAWLRLGKLRVGAHAFSEYLWRWLGDGDVFVRGALLSLQIGS